MEIGARKSSRTTGDERMKPTCFHDPAWCRALPLTERIAARRASRHPGPNGSVRGDLAQRRLQRWRSQAPFGSAARFAERLSSDGITEEEFHTFLGEPIEAVHAGAPDRPAWLADLEGAFLHPVSAVVGQGPEPPRGQEMLQFLDVIGPLVGQARERLRAGIEELARTQTDLPFDPVTIERVLLASLPGQLLPMLGRTLVLEMHVARLQGLLAGDSAEERFRAFVERLRRREAALDLFLEYPVLARQLVTRLQSWVTVNLEFLQHLCADWQDLRSVFCRGDHPGVLVHLEGGVGDVHRGGRAVLIAHFDSGFRVVFKPKPLAVDVHFQELLTWLNERGDHPPFLTPRALDRGRHGWVEFVEARGCTTAEEIRRFYRRQGGYLALLYALAATDFHFENLIAAGEHPVLIDLEALFHPRAEGVGASGIDQLAGNLMADSVLRVGLLPQRLWFNAAGEGIDLSGLGGEAGQLTPQPVPYWDAAGTDQMRLARKRMELQGGRHRPSLGGAEVHVLDYAEEIAAGFTSVYRLLREHREELLSEAGPLARFARDEVRVILRATRTYGQLLHESFHPDLLRDALDRDRFFDRLWAEVEQRPSLARVIAAEHADLHDGDIPLFTTRPDSHDLWSSAGERVADFFAEPGMVLVRRRLGQLGEADLARQLWFLRASLATLSTGTGAVQPVSPRQPAPAAAADRQRLLAAASAIGDRLEALAMCEGDEATWIGLTLLNERQWVLLPLGADLYGGLPGVTLFLAHLGAASGTERYTSLARSALATLRGLVKRQRSAFTAIGGFEGWGGIIYTLTHLAALWGQPELLAEAEEAVGLLPPLIDQDEHLDVVGGAAGCLAGLLCLYRSAPAARTLEAALRCGDRLLARAQALEQGIGWVTRAAARPLTGFAHGAAGIAWALLELSAVTGAKRFRAAARAALAYERSLFSPESGNWPDLRDAESLSRSTGDSHPPFMTAWCHGAPGIGLARLHSLRYLDDEETRAEVEAALRTTVAQGFGGNHSLCHGDLGNLELLLQAGETLSPHWRIQVGHVASQILGGMEREGWLCGIPFRTESPGMMTGLAGIGYGLLRLADPECVPSVLVLAPPTCLGQR
jgi:type 2 lantibiotic biosynthesis protein LanM